jgi:hypothetical protein
MPDEKRLESNAVVKKKEEIYYTWIDLVVVVVVVVVAILSTECGLCTLSPDIIVIIITCHSLLLDILFIMNVSPL